MSIQVPTQEVSPSTKVVEAVAAREGVETTALDVPLYEAVDPDALDALVRSSAVGRSALTVHFSYYGYSVTVSSDGSVELEERDER